MSPLSLECLTNELFECIVSYLGLIDIRNFRLASRSTAYKATQDRFKYFLKTRHVDLTRSGLHSFVRSTSHNQLGAFVENLTLVGIVYNPFVLESIVKNGYRYPTKKELESNRELQGKSLQCSEEEIHKTKDDLETLKRSREDDEDLRKQGGDASLLQKALENLSGSRQAGLQRLSLEIVVYRSDATTRLAPTDGKCWRWIFEAASRTFNLTLSCLRESRLPVRALDIFHRKPNSLACSMPCDALTHFEFKTATFGIMCSRLRSISINVSDPIVLEDEYHAQHCGDPSHQVEMRLCTQKRDLAPLRAQVDDQTSYINLAEMVQLCENLSELRLSGYCLIGNNSDLIHRQRTMRAQYVHHLSRMRALPHLHNLRLAGLPVKDNDLVAFLANHRTSLKTVELNSISIDQGSFRPVFSCMTGGNMNLEMIHLEDLRESNQLVQFSGDREQGCTTINGDYFGRNVTRRWAGDTKKEILYHFIGEGRLITPGSGRGGIGGSWSSGEGKTSTALQHLDIEVVTGGGDGVLLVTEHGYVGLGCDSIRPGYRSIVAVCSQNGQSRQAARH